MYDYAVVTAVRPDNYHATCREYEQQGFSLHESSPWRTPPYVHDSLRGPTTEARWDLVFRKAAKDISYGQMLINRYHSKLTEVANNLRVTCSNSAPALVIAEGIDKFLFEGSPEDR